MTEATPDQPTTGIDDDQLPEDLKPSEDNPLAGGLEPGETVGDLLEDGKRADEQEAETDTGTDTGTQDAPAEDAPA